MPEAGVSMARDDDEYLALSGLQHFAFCRRQWALIHIEHLWKENVLTAEGKVLHERTDNIQLEETRRNVITLRAMRVYSRTLGLSGVCDVVEMHRVEQGISLHNREGYWQPYPVEYKKGHAKANDCDRVQLCGEAMCLEEMLSCRIDEGSLYYGETRHREKVSLDEALRERVRSLVCEMRSYYDRSYTPKAKRSRNCKSCSLQDLCLAELSEKKNVHQYICEHTGKDL